MGTSFYENRLHGAVMPHAVTVYDNENFSFRAHWHQEIELVHVKEGAVLLGVNEEVKRLEAGDICLIRSGDIHDYVSGRNGSKVTTVLFRTDVVKDFYAWAERNMCETVLLTAEAVKKHGLTGIYELADRMCREKRDKLCGSREANNAYAALLLVEIMRKWPCCMADGRKTVQTAGQNQIRHILAYMEQHVEEPLTLTGLAEQFHMDSFHLSKVFNHATGMHFKNYLNRLRVTLAEEKLVSGRQPVVDIAYECGFGSVRNFNRVFKDIRGKTPVEVRTETGKQG